MTAVFSHGLLKSAMEMPDEDVFCKSGKQLTKAFADVIIFR